MRRLTGLALVLLPFAAHSAAFHIRTEDTAGLGQTYGGVTARPVALSSQYANPAHLAAFHQPEVLAGPVMHAPVIKARKATGTTALGTPVVGQQDNSNAAQPVLLPSFAAALPLTEHVTAGLTATVPWGLSTSYEPDWVGRYRAVTSEVASLNVTPAVAWQATKRLALGGGVQIQQMRARLTNAVDCGTIDVANGLGLGLTPGTPASDCFADLDGEDWGYGYNIGATYQLTPHTSIGVAYRSRIAHSLDGDVQYDRPSPVLAVVLPDGGARAGLTTPSLASVGISHTLSDRWRVGVDVQRVGWNSHENLVVDFDSGQPNSTTRADWQDIWFTGVGVEYTASRAWTLRSGVAYEQAPIPDATRDPRVPIGESYWLGAGATYAPRPDVAVIFTAFHARFADTHTDLAAEGVNSSLTADYTASNTVLAVQASVRF